MASKLDRSLDEILASQRQNKARRGGKNTTSVATAGSSSGVRKRSTRAAAHKANASFAPGAGRLGQVPTGPSRKVSSNKIIVSNLPLDVNEDMIKEYFTSVVGPIRRAILTYGPTGQSRGVATVEFVKYEHAALAAEKYNGVEVDKRPMKVELIVDPNAPLTLAERVGAPNKVSTAANTNAKSKLDKSARNSLGARPRGARGKPSAAAPRGGRSGRPGRGAPKTAEQLDQEMADYFGNDAPTPAAVANGGDAMDDDTVL